ncbi:carbon-nitrogen hydrolase family protein [Mycolicibacterium confluentis]|uniref:Hydrolase n=1 Tax=Mycolicibacterium confluentis TaxID=28047 RepID=A0A7I7Y1C5_9MYCO|nr:carbon-nitrogen hydrolase family protein [Mycolicibacterium confluentis]MCV7320406.1 carbon-nitrogen hydrolase family protein [Mycolicibacterium confluentis]ORV21871.1 hydrolase [Mycolicibacterium confluentis]BBZ35445.1 hydrolase [Mycolicibacterium confluentis]
MRIALAQISSGTDPTANLATVTDFSRRAADDGARLVVFPESTMCRFGVPLAPIAEPVDGPWADGVRRIAEECGLTVVAGMYCPAADGRVTNTLIAAGPGVDTHYDKIHLYDAFGFRESQTVAPGFDPVTISVDDVTVGITTCYDIRFPQLYLELADRGAQVITVSASWGAGPGKLDQWTLLARARALDTGSFLVAVDQAYPGDEIAATGPTGVGGSVAVGPFGQVLASAGPDPELIVCDVDVDAAGQARETLGVLTNRSAFSARDKAESRR